MAPDPLRRGVDHDVGAVLDGTGDERGERVVDDERQPAGVRHVGDGGDVRDVEARVADRLEVERARPVVDGPREVGRVRSIHEAGRDAELRQCVREEVVRAAVQARAADDVVPGGGDVEDREGLGGLAGREADGADAALERGDPLLEDPGRRVHDAGVDVPELLEREQARRVGSVVEHVARGRVDGHRPSVRGRIRLLAGVQGQRLGAVGVVGHVGDLVERDDRQWGPGSAGEAGLSWRSPVVSGRKNRTPQLLHRNCGPGTRSAAPASPVDQAARRLRPHPPHGGAASACTCSRRRWCGSRSAEYGARAGCLQEGRKCRGLRSRQPRERSPAAPRRG